MSTKDKLLKILGSWRITLPQNWREKHMNEISHKGKVKYEEQDGTLKIIPSKTFKSDDETLDVLELWRIRLPDEWRERNELEVGDFVKAVWDGGEGALVIVPVTVEVKEKVIL